MIVVVPTARTVRLDYLGPLIEAGCRFVVVDDSEGRIEIDHPAFEVHSWRQQQKRLGTLAPCIPRGNGACRDYGFLIAWWESDPGEIIVALDDDCLVYHDDFARLAEAALSSSERKQPIDPGRHWNVLDIYSNTPEGLFPRGFPYSDRAGYKPAEFGDPTTVEPSFCLGMWKGVFDVNGIDKLQGPEYVHPDAELHEDLVVVPTGSLISACSMNMIFRREVIPAVYQLPMAIDVMDGWRIDRYGDIWGGFILKALMDLRGDAMVVGEPMIRHLKDGSFEKNIWQEHICHMVNDEFLGLLADLDAPSRRDYTDLVASVADLFRDATPESSPLLRPYLEVLVTALDRWIEALNLPV